MGAVCKWCCTETCECVDEVLTGLFAPSDQYLAKAPLSDLFLRFRNATNTAVRRLARPILADFLRFTTRGKPELRDGLPSLSLKPGHLPLKRDGD